jgi:hypothetical protein
VRRFIEAHLESRQVARVVYGAIIGMALVVVLEHHPPPPGAVIASMLGTALAVGLAELYSEVLGSETRTHRRVARAELRHLLADMAAVGFGIAFPAVFFVLAAVGVLESETAFTVAKWSGLGLISLYGYAAGRLSGASVLASLLQGFAVGVIGGVLIALKALIH